MITDKELQIANNSYTHKDFYQVYPEILELVKKITNRWDPENTNESDPGVVILKLLAFIADKNNYNLDKNILEVFLPSATQEQSMRDLCGRLGYDMSYNMSATTKVTFRYQGDIDEDEVIELPAYKTAVTNKDNSINYILLKNVVFKKNNVVQTVDAMEGSLVSYSLAGSSTITLANLDDNNRLYLPETGIAENGIFIKNVGTDNKLWERVANLNTQLPLTPKWKFGFDSSKQLPYIQFPDDVSALIDEGFTVDYLRTKGVNGNISARVLTTLSSTLTATSSTKGDIELNPTENNANLVIINPSATTNGKDAETLNEAYNNFKKTVGTFDTLITCRDYANAIYNMLDSDNTTSLVSNVQVSDIRTDLVNRSSHIMTFNQYGVNYIDNSDKDNDGEKLITNFDIYVYPMKSFTGSYNETNFNNSFTSDFSVLSEEIIPDLDDLKTISHNINRPDNEDLFAIKMMCALRAKIITTYKVNLAEQYSILTNVYSALIKDYNARNVDFGYELPYESVLQTIENADSRIKNVILDDLEYTPTFMDASNKSVSISENKNLYLKILAKNIIAGRLPLFKFDASFNYPLGANKYGNLSVVYPEADKKISKLVTNYTLNVADINDLVINKNEYIQFRKQSYNTYLTYPYLVYYNWQGANVKANTDYKLKGDDKLYIYYKDANNEYQNITYTASDNTVIRANFSLTKTTTYTIKSGFTFQNIEGMKQLSTSEQIELRKPVQTVLDNSDILCYWLTQDGTIHFVNNEYTLKEGEYFFYTDSAKTELFTFSTGTKLIANNLGTDPSSTFTLKYVENDINLDDIVQNGISALVNNWQSIQFNSNSTLTIKEMDLLTLAENDILNSISLIDNTITTIDSNEWVKVSSASYTLNGDSITDLDNIEIDDEKWEVCTRYDLNVGPDTIQTLNNNDSVTMIFNDNSSTTISKQTSTDKNPSILTNYRVQRSGNEIWIENAAYTSSDGVSDFKLSIFEDNQLSGNVSGNNQNIILTKVDDKYNRIEFDKYTSITFDNLIPATDNGIMMIYVEGSDSVVLSDESNSNTLSFIDSSSNPVKSLNLKQGINNIKIDKTAKLKLTGWDTSSEGLILFSDVKLIVKTNNGIDIESLNIQNSDITALLDNISKYSVANDGTGIERNIFYYGADLDNNLVIDTDMNDVNVWFDANNIANRFVICQLDTKSFENISIAKSSRL